MKDVQVYQGIPGFFGKYEEGRYRSKKNSQKFNSIRRKLGNYYLDENIEKGMDFNDAKKKAEIRVDKELNTPEMLTQMYDRRVKKKKSRIQFWSTRTPVKHKKKRNIKW